METDHKRDRAVAMAELSAKIRQFETGATRDTDEGKFDYEAFFSPAVLERRAAYMHKHRFQRDGSVRDGDNWQKGIPRNQYMKSLLRHVMDLWMGHRRVREVDFIETLCAIAFNTEGYLHEYLLGRDVGLPKPAADGPNTIGVASPPSDGVPPAQPTVSGAAPGLAGLSWSRITGRAGK